MKVIEQNINKDDLVLSHLYNISDVKLMQDLIRHNPKFKDYLNLNHFSTWDWVNLFENLDDGDNKLMKLMLNNVDLLHLNGNHLTTLLINYPKFFNKYLELDLWWKFSYDNWGNSAGFTKDSDVNNNLYILWGRWKDYPTNLPSIIGNTFVDDDIDYNNYYKGTRAVFEVCDKPEIEPDYVSKNAYDEISSRYWYGEDEKGKYIIRESDHWDYVGSCLWVLTEGGEYIPREEWLGEINYGKTYFKNNKK